MDEKWVFDDLKKWLVQGPTEIGGGFMMVDRWWFQTCSYVVTL